MKRYRNFKEGDPVLRIMGVVLALGIIASILRGCGVIQ